MKLPDWMWLTQNWLKPTYCNWMTKIMNWTNFFKSLYPVKSLVIGLISNLYSKMIKQYYFLSKITVSLVYVQNVTWRTVLIYIKIWQLLFTLSSCQMTRISLFEFNNWFNWEIIQITGSFFFFNIPLLFLKIPPFFQKVPITAQSKKYIVWKNCLYENKHRELRPVWSEW